MQANNSAGSIYDLGYRPYDGVRLGRRYAIMSLFWYSLKSIFGLGRSGWAKFFPFGLATIAILPAIAQLAIAAIAPEDFELVRPENHFGYISIIVALFCAVSAPEILGRDQRARTLTLYFSRALSRLDYVTAKVMALVAALFLLTFLPQVLLMIGAAVAQEEVLTYLKDNAGDIPPTIASSILVALVMGSISLSIASQSHRRAISTIAVLGYFIIFTSIGNVFVETLSGDARKFSLLLSPLDLLDGAIFWLFGVEPSFESSLARANLNGAIYFLAGIGYIALALAPLYRRFQKMSV